MSLPGYTYQCALKYTDNRLQTLQDKDLILTIENNLLGGLIGVMGDRFVKLDENRQINSMDATNLYVYSMSQMLPYDENEIWHGHPDLYMNKLDENLNTPDDNDVAYFMEVDINYPENIKERTNKFPSAPGGKVNHKVKNNDYMKKHNLRLYKNQRVIMWLDW